METFSREECRQTPLEDLQTYFALIFEEFEDIPPGEAKGFYEVLSHDKSPEEQAFLPDRHVLNVKDLTSWSDQLMQTWLTDAYGYRKSTDTFAAYRTGYNVAHFFETLAAEIGKDHEYIYLIFPHYYGYCLEPRWLTRNVGDDGCFWFPPDLSWVFCEEMGEIKAEGALNL